MMDAWGWIGFGIVLFLGVSAFVLVVLAGMLSSQISREEEEHWVLDKDQQWRRVKRDD